MKNNFRKRRRKKHNNLDTETAFLHTKDSLNVGSNSFDSNIEKPIEIKNFIYFFIFCFSISIIFLTKTFYMQIIKGDEYLSKSISNYHREYVLFAKRGIIFDRNKNELVWNEKQKNLDYPKRVYLNKDGFSHLLGFLSYPQKDKSGKYFEKEYVGKGGVEKNFNKILNGKLGKINLQVDAFGKIISDNTILKPEDGKNITLTIDENIQEQMYKSLSDYVKDNKFMGGAAAVMDVNNGEILSMISFPEYSSNILTEGKNREKIKEYLYEKGKPFLNKVVYGEFTPGSIIKPFIALAALENNIIDPYKKVKTNGSLVIQNRWDPSKPSIFRDWRNQGNVNMFDAMAWSSNVYFYRLGGGYLDEFKGLGIRKIEKYLHLFGFGTKTRIEGFSEKKGLVPSPEWKEKVFKNNPWNVGNTYYTSIGQFGFLATPMQILTAVSAIANNGEVLEPKIILDYKKEVKINLNFKKKNFDIVKEAMRQTTLRGTTQVLNLDFVKIASKSGTAQIKGRTRLNSWVIGFFPYKKPKYAFIFLAENGPKKTRKSVSFAASDFFKKLYQNEKTKKYFTK